MVSSRAKAAPERAPTTVLRSSTTLLMLPEVADAPASMCKCKLGGESTGTAGKGQSREAAAGVCQWGCWVRVKRCETGASAPCRSSAMPMFSRPAILFNRWTLHLMRCVRITHWLEPGDAQDRLSTHLR